MNDERLRWALERLASANFTVAKWALGREIPPLAKRDLDKQYADTFKLPRSR